METEGQGRGKSCVDGFVVGDVDGEVGLIYHLMGLWNAEEKYFEDDVAFLEVGALYKCKKISA